MGRICRFARFAFVAVLLGTFVLSAAAQTEPERSQKKPGRLKAPKTESQQADIINIDRCLEGKTLVEGRNDVCLSPQGLRVTVVVKEGRIVKWIFTDRRGMATGKRMHKPIRLSKRADGTFLLPAPDGVARKGETRCWKCYPAPDGGQDCVMVECPIHF
jgi:hypothetical protein